MSFDSSKELTLEQISEGVSLPKAHRSSAFGYADNYVGVGVTGEIRQVAEALCYAVMSFSRLPVTVDGIENLLTYLVYLRVLQLSNRLPKTIAARSVEIPCFFFPFLAAIKNVDIPLSGRRLYCVPIDTVDSEGNPAGDGKGEDHFMGVEVSVLEASARQTLPLLKGSGVKTTTGLPTGLTTQSDNLFRIHMDESGDLLVAGPDVAETDLLVRSVINMTFNPLIWGEARTRYTNIGDYRPSFSTIVRASLTS